MARLLSKLVLAIGLTTTAAAPFAQPLQPAAPDAPVYQVPPAPGQLVDVGGGRRLHIRCKGDASGPTVIFEAGLSGFPANGTYGPAQDRIATFARVCTYDRAGLGWSDRAPGPRTFDAVVADLHTLLHRAHIPGPYVLVGHSFGGLIVRRYVARYPRDVVGVVLADATNELTFGGAAGASTDGAVGQIDAVLAHARPGVPVVTLPPNTPPDVVMSALPSTLMTERDEFQMVAMTSPAMHRPWGFGTLGDRPLIVMRRGWHAEPPSEMDIQWQASQERLPELSSNSALVVAQSGHVIPYEAPDLTAAAVRRVLTAATTGRRVADIP